MAKYRPLTPNEKAWANNLRGIYERKKGEMGLSQQKLGDMMGISQSAVGQYINGKIPMGLEAKISFAIALRCNVAEIDPEIPFAQPPSPDEQQILESYRRSGEKGKKLLREVAEAAPLYDLTQKPND